MQTGEIDRSCDTNGSPTTGPSACETNTVEARFGCEFDGGGALSGATGSLGGGERERSCETKGCGANDGSAWDTNGAVGCDIEAKSAASSVLSRLARLCMGSMFCTISCS